MSNQDKTVPVESHQQSELPFLTVSQFSVVWITNFSWVLSRLIKTRLR
jgi:hypothetical protein